MPQVAVNMPQSPRSTIARLCTLCVRHLAPRNRRECAAMAAGLVALALGLGVSLPEGLRTFTAPSTEQLREVALASGWQGSICPDGWAEAHAATLDMTESEISAWYLAESFRASDTEVRRGAAAFFRNPGDFRARSGLTATGAQIALCIAESRRMI
ncbi:hypothetical protein [Jannaschia sp. W003]|uniref:hypothetical protein n=1 Tax=Jannaschia sp. W003 TaxID=2867012 RepID=UPI0021A67A76|nr:hypothetical protein [Jannaschia sp. W003]UWQ21153.1 hypothetical protein K3554_14440 [Jannaschia sp. W003]